MKEIKTDYGKKRNRAITHIKKGIAFLIENGYTIEVEPTETMIGSVIDHIYARVRGKKSIYEQKYLFTLNKKEKTK